MKKYLSILPLLLIGAVSCNNEEDPDAPKYSSYQTKVFEYTPAPGQFINDPTVGFSSAVSSPKAAADYALKRLHEKKFVSLGSFGGTIVVGFDHSIKATGAYDFAIQGNAFIDSNEPGIVWVMQDTNKNGLPDDEWFELRGSETGKEGTVENFSVTYYRPEQPQMPVKWRASDGREGEISYLKSYHDQDYYYPLWIKEDSYTLTGTYIVPRNYQNSKTGVWINPPFDYGYADNCGSDDISGRLIPGNTGQMCGFKISNALRKNGTQANLTYIDFIKVQTATLTSSGIIGENSTEVCSFIDISLILK